MADKQPSRSNAAYMAGAILTGFVYAAGAILGIYVLVWLAAPLVGMIAGLVGAAAIGIGGPIMGLAGACVVIIGIVGAIKAYRK